MGSQWLQVMNHVKMPYSVKGKSVYLCCWTEELWHARGCWKEKWYHVKISITVSFDQLADNIHDMEMTSVVLCMTRNGWKHEIELFRPIFIEPELAWHIVTIVLC